MKKLLLASAVALFGLANAQISKGTVYVSGQVGYSQEENNNNDSKVESFRIVPTVGYFVAPNLAIGTGVGYVNDKVTVSTTNTVGSAVVTSENKSTQSAFVVAPFVRKYWTLGDKLYIFGQLEVPMEFGKLKEESTSTANVGGNITTTSTSDEANYTSVGVNIKPGLDYFLNKNWTIEATIGEFGYNTSKLDVDGAKSINNYKFGLNLSSVTIGVKYVFGK
ncbi:outer membrane beta-barrel protein [Chryseobacterium daecheongense]|uniref:Outer membrane protein with beta-barrel domain n=1 Tax=Chryseobacterium daecheongense TaxID=192389 RepID=A0A3N0W4B7_9FLAO|nr:outer membrane beta-barrel protein [Chryseobacterium daecheongense]ROH99919.1 porin family protein [Chryseobacterium daecheongense]TDX95148.1 outer membrane protein with beta-barrel domain [Chryseobacterium daecheongense]